MPNFLPWDESGLKVGNSAALVGFSCTGAAATVSAGGSFDPCPRSRQPLTARSVPQCPLFILQHTMHLVDFTALACNNPTKVLSALVKSSVRPSSIQNQIQKCWRIGDLDCPAHTCCPATAILGLMGESTSFVSFGAVLLSSFPTGFFPVVPLS